MIKLSELILFKPSLKASLEDDDTKKVWAHAFLKTYNVDSVIQAMEQIKHSSCEWVNFGTIAEETRRIEAASSTVYRPFADPKRLTVSQLREAVADGCDQAAEQIKLQQRKAVAIRKFPSKEVFDYERDAK